MELQSCMTLQEIHKHRTVSTGKVSHSSICNQPTLHLVFTGSTRDKTVGNNNPPLHAQETHKNINLVQIYSIDLIFWVFFR